MITRHVLFCCLLAPLLGIAQTNQQPNANPNPDSVRARRARMAVQAKEEYEHKVFTHADTLRGTDNPERSWWDIQRYDIIIKPDYNSKSTVGSDLITYTVLSDQQPGMQIDLMDPLHIDSVIANGKENLSFTKEGAAWHIKTSKQSKGTTNTVKVCFSGTPVEAKRPPWNGGWTWTKDSLGRPWMTVTCQGLGASVWYPCKDYQGDEPDKGGSMTMIVPDSLVGVSNGRLQFKKSNGDGTTTYKWAVVNPISNYCLIPYIGKYVTFHEDFQGEKGHLDLDYWVMDYNLAKAKAYLPEQVHNMLHAHEHWMGPYPFYEDSYKLVDVEHTGMEHQSAVAYGNHYAFGYRGRGPKYGLMYDFIIIHESGHEWFGNNLTTKDLADMWVHEGFTNYSETLFVDYMWGVDAGNDYNIATRNGIRNDRPIIPRYGVNEQGSGDMYPKGGNLLQAIRHSIDNDEQWRQILRGLQKTFYHQTVTSAQVEHYVSEHAGFDLTKVFDQYLRTTQIPDLEFTVGSDGKKVTYRYTNCITGFNLPLSLDSGSTKLRIFPTDQWKTTDLKGAEASLFTEDAIKKMYYIGVKQKS
jgi:aminopeptidase N